LAEFDWRLRLPHGEVWVIKNENLMRKPFVVELHLTSVLKFMIIMEVASHIV